jgi:hypothetical protein
MITQGFLMEFELGLLRAYNRAARKVEGKKSSDVSSRAQVREDFIREFMGTFSQEHSVLGWEIEKGGHDSSKLLQKISKEVEGKVRTFLLQKEPKDRATFERMVRDLKNDIRNVFYERYLGE